MMNNRYANHLLTSIIGLSLLLTPLQLIAEEVVTSGEEDDSTAVCIELITFAKNPKTGTVIDFPTPCDVPDRWKIISDDQADQADDSAERHADDSADPHANDASASEPQTEQPSGDQNTECAEVIMYALSPQTGRWYQFSTPCDIPQGWENSSTIQQDTIPANNSPVCLTAITYAQSPKTGNWYAFPNSCTPSGWEITLVKPNVFSLTTHSESSEDSCSSFHVTYDNGILHIPFVYINGLEKAAFKEVELKLVPPGFNPPLFFLYSIEVIEEVSDVSENVSRRNHHFH